MKYGMFYGYWKRDWSGDYLPLVSRAKKCGFDILAVSSGYLVEKTEAELDALRREAEEWEVELHAGFGPGPDCNLASQDQAVTMGGFFKCWSGLVFLISAATTILALRRPSLCRSTRKGTGSGCWPGWTGSPGRQGIVELR